VDSPREQLVRVLAHFDITFSAITTGALNVQCPFCDDAEFHRGIYLDNFRSSCFKCKKNVDLFEYINAVASVSQEELTQLLEGNHFEEQSALSIITSIINRSEQEAQPVVKTVSWPPAGSISLKKMKTDSVANSFLQRRKLSYDFCCSRDVYIGIVGRWSGRFLIPTYEHGKVVAFQGRDMSNSHPAKYLTEGDVSNYLYNFDNLKPDVPLAVTEGILSGWRIGGNFTCTFSTSLSEKQILLLLNSKPSELILCWDIGQAGGDAFFKSRAVLSRLSTFFPNLFYVPLPEGEDPDSLGTEVMHDLIRNSKVRYGVT